MKQRLFELRLDASEMFAAHSTQALPNVTKIENDQLKKIDQLKYNFGS